MAFRAMVSKSSLAFVVISPPITTTFDLTKVSQATRLYLSPARHASRTASEIVSATLSGWPSPTDSEEKIYVSITLQKKAREVAGCARLRQICRGASPARAVHQVVEITARTTHKYGSSRWRSQRSSRFRQPETPDLLLRGLDRPRDAFRRAVERLDL